MNRSFYSVIQSFTEEISVSKLLIGMNLSFGILCYFFYINFLFKILTKTRLTIRHFIDICNKIIKKIKY